MSDTDPPRPLPQIPLREISAVSLDFEATGPEAHKREIIDIGAVRIVGGQVRETQILNQRILPKGDITLGAWWVHGLRRKHLRRAPPLETFWPELGQFLGDDIIVGHHIHFDIRLLRHQLRRLGIRWKPNPALCTGFLHMRATGQSDPPALDDLAARFRVPAAARHTGLGDAMLAAHVMTNLPPMLEKAGVVTVDDALRAQAAVHFRHIRKMRGNRGRL